MIFPNFYTPRTGRIQRTPRIPGREQTCPLPAFLEKGVGPQTVAASCAISISASTKRSFVSAMKRWTHQVIPQGNAQSVASRRGKAARARLMPPFAAIPLA